MLTTNSLKGLVESTTSIFGAFYQQEDRPRLSGEAIGRVGRIYIRLKRYGFCSVCIGDILGINIIALSCPYLLGVQPYSDEDNLLFYDQMDSYLLSATAITVLQ